ncbi:MAG TPA: hypothetical protein DCP90_06860 [Clostridiales bacterium]|nr:MAG: hypothetical protein A2Y22_02140 [Clostridiales bacterium GWD2_32_59]HAN10315.1 hypothetical protein [Clostridiales bacterium]
MRDDDILNDILKDRITNQCYYNECILNNRNPEVRNFFTEARDDETRAIIRLQQKVERIQNNSGTIVKIFSTKDS